MTTTPELTPLEQARQRLANYLQAETRILQSQEYAVGQGGTARRNTQAEIATLQAAQSGARRVTYLRPR